MSWFRPRSSDAIFVPITPEGVRLLVAEMLRPAHLFVSPDVVLEWEHVEGEEIVWEIFQGRLLDAAHSRERRRFAAWNVYQRDETNARCGEPLLAVKLDVERGELYVVRGIDSYVWEGYDAGGNVYRSRERRKWVRELVAAIRLDRFADLEELRDELACRLYQAVVGTSRLPLSSVETPLPGFSFGQLFYCYRPKAAQSAVSPRSWRELITDLLTPLINPSEQAHLLETFLHAASIGEMPVAAAAFVHRWTEIGRTIDELPALLRRLFNEVSLSPYTDLVEKTLAFLPALEIRDIFKIDNTIDFLGHLLRHIGRHLTAFDLLVFHHRGANYPDALLLDAVLKEYLALVERCPQLFFDAGDDSEAIQRHKRIRRRALRQGWLLRRRYEGHFVPDSPTSPGENSRVLPSSHPRIAEEQIVQLARRTRRLFAGDPLSRRLGPQAAHLLRRSLLDLEHDEEWRELGLAVFLDRPLGVGKAATEPDGTLLLSAEAFSISIARERLHALARDVNLPPEDTVFQRLLAHAEVRGASLDAIGGAARPGGVSLTDARRAAVDFVFLRTTPGSVRAFLAQFDFAPLARRFHLADVLDGTNMLIARSATGTELMIRDARLRLRVELEVLTANGYDSRAGREYPVDGLRVLRVWEPSANGEELHFRDLRRESLVCTPLVR